MHVNLSHAERERDSMGSLVIVCDECIFDAGPKNIKIANIRSIFVSGFSKFGFSWAGSN